MKVTLSHPCSAGDGKQKFLVFSTSPINPVPESPKFVKSTNVTRRDGRNLCNPQPVWERVVRGDDTPRSGGQGEGNGIGAAPPPPRAKSLRQHRCIVLIPPLRGAGGSIFLGPPAPPLCRQTRQLRGTPGSFPKPGPTVQDPRQVPTRGISRRLPVSGPSAAPAPRDPRHLPGTLRRPPV